MCLFFVCYVYQFAYIPLAWLPARKRQTPKPDPDHTFAVLIAAHDEATVIGALVSIPLVMREQRTVLGTFRQNWLPFLAGIVLATGLSLLRLSALVNGLGFSIGTALYAFAAGALVISAMVLPGISGLSLLMSCGLYLPVIAAMKDLLHFSVRTVLAAGCGGVGCACGLCGRAALHPPLDAQSAGRRHLRRAGHDARFPLCDCCRPGDAEGAAARHDAL